jgi:hypothetical protein
MGLLSQLKTTDTDIKEDKDSLGAGYLLESGAYKCVIKLAYVNKSANGATGLNIHLESENGTMVRQTLWIASGDAKGNKTYSVNKKGEKNFLPGYNVANALCLLTVGKGITDLETETKVVNLYDFAARAELPTKVEAIMELKGEEIIAGVIKETVDKNVKTDSGEWVPNGETREQNEIDKIFRASDGLTVQEIKAEQTEAVFLEDWTKKNEGVTKNKAKGAVNGSTAGMPAAAPAKKLFA